MADAFRGMKHQKIKEERLDYLPLFACGSNYSKQEAERIYRTLIAKDILGEVCIKNKSGYPAAYLKVDFKEESERPAHNQKTLKTFVSKAKLAAQGNKKDDGQENNPVPEVLVATESACFMELLAERNDSGAMPPPTFSDACLFDVAKALPVTSADFLKVKGMISLLSYSSDFLHLGVDKRKFARYGNRFLAITQRYRETVECIQEDQENRDPWVPEREPDRADAAAEGYCATRKNSRD
ncbi:hypothetical protein HK101_006994 [Irineochytrium annulatum]|nr:hypothetical protein HK101_006994 [Irineochytrium annulatum]